MSHANQQRDKRQNATRAHFALRELNIPVEQVVDTLRMRTADWDHLDKEVQEKAKRILKKKSVPLFFTI